MDSSFLRFWELGELLLVARQFKPIEMATGGSSLEGADLMKKIENLALIENQRAGAHCTPKIQKLLREDPLSFFVLVQASIRKAWINLESTEADYLVTKLDHDFIPHIKTFISVTSQQIEYVV